MKLLRDLERMIRLGKYYPWDEASLVIRMNEKDRHEFTKYFDDLIGEHMISVDELQSIWGIKILNEKWEGPLTLARIENIIDNESIIFKEETNE